MCIHQRIHWSKTRCLCAAVLTITPTSSCDGTAWTPMPCGASPRSWTAEACTSTPSPLTDSLSSRKRPTAGSWITPYPPYSCKMRVTTRVRLRADGAARGIVCSDICLSKVRDKRDGAGRLNHFCAIYPDRNSQIILKCALKTLNTQWTWLPNAH